MSLVTWKKRFYRVPADKVAASRAIAHSLTKWRGLRPQPLAEHQLRTGPWGRIMGQDSDEYLAIDSDSCALRHRHLAPDCDICPLKQTLGQRCDAGNTVPSTSGARISIPSP